MRYPDVELLAAAAPATAALLVVTGVAKTFVPVRRAAAPDALAALLGGRARARRALRAVGAVELLLATALVVLPSGSAGTVTAALGASFVGYLLWARHAVPDSACGCTGSTAPVTLRTFVRAAGVAGAGLAVAVAGTPWWQAAADTTGPFAAAVAGVGVGYLVSSPEADRMWLLPLRRLRRRVFGHRTAVPDGPVPVDASVDLLESSVAWWSAAGLVRSGLVDHWVADGWRLLRYAGRHEAATGARPVTIVFAVDARATVCSPRAAVIRVAVVDDGIGEVVDDPPLRVPAADPGWRADPVGASE